MKSRNSIMQALFSELSEKNKDIIILIAKSIKVAQITDEQSYKHYKTKKRTEEKVVNDKSGKTSNQLEQLTLQDIIL